MILVESIEHINNELVSLYGRTGDNPTYRVVFSDDMIEKRWVTHSREGFEYVQRRVEERYKYKHYIQGKYILERFLDVIPELDTDLIYPFSYEPVWVFEDDKGNYLPPRIFACKFIIEKLHEASKRAIGVKYKDEEDDPKISREVKEARIKKLEEELFGNETDVTDALAYREGVSLNGNNIPSRGTNDEEKNDKSTSKSAG